MKKSDLFLKENHYRILFLSIVVSLLVCWLVPVKSVLASTDTIVNKTTMVPKTYVRKTTTGGTYQLKMSGQDVVFCKETHYLKNYAHTTWEATKKLYLKKPDGKTYLYYYIKNKSGSVAGWIWHQYLMPGTDYQTLLGIAKKQLGKVYAYGAVGPSYFDCSGLTQYVYKQASDKTLQRTAQAQYNGYQHVSSTNKEPGDLAFFGTSAGSISHVGLYIGDGKMIDAQDLGVITESISSPWWHLVGYSRPEKLAQ